MQQVKVPKEILELAYEAEACRHLSEIHDQGIFPSLKAIYYGTKAQKANRLVWRALRVSHPETEHGHWVLDVVTGLATKQVESEMPAPEAKPKKPRKPRAPKAEVKPAAPAANEGETV